MTEHIKKQVKSYSHINIAISSFKQYFYSKCAQNLSFFRENKPTLGTIDFDF